MRKWWGGVSSREGNLWRQGSNFVKRVIKDSHLIPDLSQTGTEDSFDQEMRPAVGLQKNTKSILRIEVNSGNEKINKLSAKCKVCVSSLRRCLLWLDVSN